MVNRIACQSVCDPRQLHLGINVKYLLYVVSIKAGPSFCGGGHDVELHGSSVFALHVPLRHPCSCFGFKPPASSWPYQRPSQTETGPARRSPICANPTCEAPLTVVHAKLWLELTAQAVVRSAS